jgi:hypothetical protein
MKQIAKSYLKSFSNAQQVVYLMYFTSCSHSYQLFLVHMVFWTKVPVGNTRNFRGKDGEKTSRRYRTGKPGIRPMGRLSFLEMTSIENMKRCLP